MPARKTPAREPAKQNKRLIRRELGAAVCFIVAIFTFFALFGAEAWLLNHIRTGLEFIIGGGFAVFPFAALVASAMLLFHRGRPVALRTACALTVPFFVGIIAGLFGEETEGFTTAARWLSDILRTGISRPVALILLIFSIIACLLAVIRKSPVAIFDALKSKPKREYPEEEMPQAPEKPLPPKKKPPEPKEKSRRAEFEVPAVFTSPEIPEAETGELPVGVLRERDERIKPPDEVMKKFAKEEQAEDEQLAPIPPIGVKIEPIPPPVDNSPPETPETEKPGEIAEPNEEVAAQSEPKPLPLTEPKPDSKPFPSIKIQPIVEPVATVSVAADEPFAALEPLTPYRIPPTNILTETRPAYESMSGKNEEEIKNNAERLISVLSSFGIGATVRNITCGPSVARFEIEPEAGVKLSSLTSRADDIALALGAVGVHIAPVPGLANVVGVEVPNRMVSTVYIRDLIESEEFQALDSPTAFVLGRDIAGQNIVADIAKLTHLLIAGTTGSGKSVCMNTLITSMLYKAKPDELRFIMVDPKMVELGVYNGIPHLLSEVVTDPKRASEALAWAVSEMDNRYNLLMQKGVRDIVSYNQTIEDSGEGAKMPRIVIIIDEMADLMMVAHKEVETAVARIAQKARACGVHLILATQRPESKVVTGIIKSNTPSRIAFAVKGNIDSRIILDVGGAEKLIGRGDMLYLPIGAPKPLRVQGCYVSEREVKNVVDYISKSSPSDYSDEKLVQFLDAKEGVTPPASLEGSSPDLTDDTDNKLLPAAIEAIIESGQGSTSYLQRRLKLGYARAARLMDEMEKRGIVGPLFGSKPRDVLVTMEEWEEMSRRDVR